MIIRKSELFFQKVSITAMSITIIYKGGAQQIGDVTLGLKWDINSGLPDESVCVPPLRPPKSAPNGIITFIQYVPLHRLFKSVWTDTDGLTVQVHYNLVLLFVPPRASFSVWIRRIRLLWKNVIFWWVGNENGLLNHIILWKREMFCFAAIISYCNIIQGFVTNFCLHICTVAPNHMEPPITEYTVAVLQLPRSHKNNAFSWTAGSCVFFVLVKITYILLLR